MKIYSFGLIDFYSVSILINLKCHLYYNNFRIYAPECNINLSSNAIYLCIFFSLQNCYKLEPLWKQQPKKHTILLNTTIYKDTYKFVSTRLEIATSYSCEYL